MGKGGGDWSLGKGEGEEKGREWGEEEREKEKGEKRTEVGKIHLLKGSIVNVYKKGS